MWHICVVCICMCVRCVFDVHVCVGVHAIVQEWRSKDNSVEYNGI